MSEWNATSDATSHEEVEANIRTRVEEQFERYYYVNSSMPWRIVPKNSLTEKQAVYGLHYAIHSYFRLEKNTQIADHYIAQMTRDLFSGDDLNNNVRILCQRTKLVHRYEVQRKLEDNLRQRLIAFSISQEVSQSPTPEFKYVLTQFDVMDQMLDFQNTDDSMALDCQHQFYRIVGSEDSNLYAPLEDNLDTTVVEISCEEQSIDPKVGSSNTGQYLRCIGVCGSDRHRSVATRCRRYSTDVNQKQFYLCKQHASSGRGRQMLTLYTSLANQMRSKMNFTDSLDKRKIFGYRLLEYYQNVQSIIGPDSPTRIQRLKIDKIDPVIIFGSPEQPSLHLGLFEIDVRNVPEYIVQYNGGENPRYYYVLLRGATHKKRGIDVWMIQSQNHTPIVYVVTNNFQIKNYKNQAPSSYELKNIVMLQDVLSVSTLFNNTKEYDRFIISPVL